MSEMDVTTKSKNGQWVNEVEGHRDLSRSFSSREEAIDAGRQFALTNGTEHIIEESEPTGGITDGGDLEDDIPEVDDALRPGSSE